MGGPRSWYYDDEDDLILGDLDFKDLYLRCEGTILYRWDCGVEACGNAVCCGSTGPNSFIFFLPGELEYQQAQHPQIPFQRVSTEDQERHHCIGSDGCIYHQRPLDCRSYPFFPAVVNSFLVGYFDFRGAHDCPLQLAIELLRHLNQIHAWWSQLLNKKHVIEWAEDIGSQYLRNTSVIGIPESKGGESG